MTHDKKQQLYISVGVVTLLLLIRIVFFLKDGTNDFIERILFWLIYGGSFVVLYFLFSPLKQNLLYIWNNNKSKIFIFAYIIVLEVLFALKNNLNYTFVSAFSVLFIVSLFFIVSVLLPRMLAKIFDIAFIIVYGAYMFAQDFYYRIFSDFFSFIEAGTLREGVESSSNMYVFNYLHLVIVFMIILTLFLYIRYYDKNKFKGKKINLLKYIAVLFLLVNLNAEYPVKAARLHLSDHYLYTSTYSKTRFVSHFGGINLLTKDVISLIIPDVSNKKHIEYINDYYENNQKPHVDNEYTNIFKDKNLIIVLAESFDDIALSEELTPSILKLKNEGLDFTNHFTPVFPRTTCDTEIILNTSLIPSIQDGPTCYVYNQNSYNTSIANLFNNKDYVTNALHSNYKEFYTRHLVYKGLGYNNFYGQHEIGLSDSDRRYDEVFMDMSKDYVINTENKFYSMMLTLSGHSPYTNVNLAVEKNYDLVDEYYQFKH
ncbi:hypothetical protein CI105_03340 [Candidatus Izimaplasma bacterium ZiA1]|uniref:LTA synthase family protein n=1 Tax=Candidatus Izimoplasma sp. ZiA1 TaxID=2024899 RepID=UPI000BAA8E38|nr:hypothetical protein CI105_03340 [Candidatus Izimaplasma bacterium ZiA1]